MHLISDLRSKFAEINEAATASDSLIFLTKNDYVMLVITSIEQRPSLPDTFEITLN